MSEPGTISGAAPGLVRPTESLAAGDAPRAEQEAEALAQRMHDAWQAGERVSAEQLLQNSPLVASCASAAVRVVYEEVCLRQELGCELTAAEWFRRFPAWRAELEALLACHRLLEPKEVCFPVAGESFGDFRLLAELGRGAQSRVFLATQTQLAGRLVVLKIAPGDGDEHALLSTLQHTNIVPLYSIRDEAERGLRAYCMPYLGGATLDRVLAEIRAMPRHERTGRRMVQILDDCRSAHWKERESGGPARRLLERLSFEQTINWIGICLADALAHVHERGLVHLDLKPSNILIAADGQPMLLDFHLARDPVRQGELLPGRFGGTPNYMSPEQAAALEAAAANAPAPLGVDGRSDLFSLGVLLRESLADARAARGASAARGSDASDGLADILARCISPAAEDRYASAAELAEDLRRQLKDLPLCGVRNRFGERWRKWRRRKPSALPLATMLMVVLIAAASTVAVGGIFLRQERARARQGLADGRRWLAAEQFDSAAQALEQGLASAKRLPLEADLSEQITAELEQVRKARLTRQLHSLVDRLRIIYGVAASLPGERLELAALCRRLWERRHEAFPAVVPEGFGKTHVAERENLLELGVLWADLRSRLGDGEARREALQILREAGDMCGENPVLEFERRRLAEDAGPPPLEDGLVPRSPWEHWALGRALLAAGNEKRAERQLAAAIELAPDVLWPRYYLSHCAQRLGNLEQALSAADICVALAPRRAECHHLRGTAHAAMRRWAEARKDFSRALDLDPKLGLAALNRGVANYELDRLHEARADFDYARRQGVPEEFVVPHSTLVEARLAAQ